MNNPELDKYMATEIMGWEYRDVDHVKGEPSGFFVDGKYRIGTREWSPSAPDGHVQAFMCVEKMIEKHFYPDLISTQGKNGVLWRCEVHTADDKNHPNNPYNAVNDSAPLAICLALREAHQND